MGPSVINFDTPRRLSTPLSPLSGSEAGERGLEVFPSFRSLSDLEAFTRRKLPSESDYDSRCNALTRQRGEPLNSFLRLDYDSEDENENEREFVIRASSFPNLCSLFPAPGSLMPAAWAFVLGLLLLVGLRGLRLGVSRRALRLMRRYLRTL